LFKSEHPECAVADARRREDEAAAESRAAQEKAELRTRLIAEALVTIHDGGDLLTLEGKLLDEITAGRLSHC
jgi:hypothetical protein